MKILAIRLKNLASLAGPFEIDFTAEPLASAGLFAITGPTGAGKSTLLDALCLALFGAVPRLRYRPGQNAGCRHGYFHRRPAHPDSTRHWRRLCRGGFCRCQWPSLPCALGSQPRPRQSQRQAAEQPAKPDRPGQRPTAGQPENRVQDPAGIGPGPELRAVHPCGAAGAKRVQRLPQGHDNERSELLEKLTDTALYTQLGRRAFDKAKEAKDAHKQLQDQATGVVPLAPEARAELDQQLAEAQQQLKTQQAQLKQLELQHTWPAELREWQERHQHAVEQLQRDEATWASQGQQRQDLNLLEQLAPQRHHFLRQAELATLLTPLAAQIAQHLEQQTALHTRQEQAQHQQVAAQAALAEALKTRPTPRPSLRQAIEEQNTLAHVSRELAKRSEENTSTKAPAPEGQALLDGLQHTQAQGTERLQRLTTEFEHSAALAPLSDA